MEVILKKDVEKLGYKDDIVEVKNGFGRNFLIPQGHAVLATDSEKKQLNEVLKQRRHKEEKVIAEANESAAKIKEMEIVIPAKVGKDNKLFGSIGSPEISDYLAKEGITIDRKYINVAGNSAKTIGVFNTTIRLHREVIVNTEFTVSEDK